MQADGSGRVAAPLDTPRRTCWRRWHAGAVAFTACAALAVAGCGSSSSNTSSSTSSGSGSSASAANPGLAHAEAIVAKYRQPVSTYSLPTSRVKGVAKLKGKTVMYIPLINAIPAFQITAGSMKTALAKVGVKLQPCNGGANPTTVAACIAQAKSQGMSGIVTDAIPYELAATAFASATSAGIPVLIADQYPENRTNGGKLAYQPGNVNQPALIADWIIADSKGKANAIVGEEADSPSSIAYVQKGLVPEFRNYCPSCKVTINKMTQSAPDQIASAVNSSLLKDPGVQYYYTEFEDDLQGVLQGVQQAGKTTGLKVEAATATIAGLQKMKAGQSVAGEVGDDVNYEGWADADEILRMMAGQKVVTENIPERLFDSTNINKIALTPAAQAAGVWYGNPSTFETGFEKLWGV
jgi:ribose transport system substrate-binding protein